MKKGDTIYVINRAHPENKVNEVKILSIGKKYITTTFDTRIKFDVQTLREVGGFGLIKYLITDLDEYMIQQKYSIVRRELSRMNWNNVTRGELDDIIKILGLESMYEDI